MYLLHAIVPYDQKLPYLVKNACVTLIESERIYSYALKISAL